MACNAQRATHEMACLPAPIDCNAHSFARCSFSAIVVLVALYLLALLAFLVRWPIKVLSLALRHRHRARALVALDASSAVCVARRSVQPVRRVTLRVAERRTDFVGVRDAAARRRQREGSAYSSPPVADEPLTGVLADVAEPKLASKQTIQTRRSSLWRALSRATAPAARCRSCRS
jgi:hypothetical protein